MPTADELNIDRLEEAALWLGRLESGRVDQAAFERWRAEPANAIAFIKVSQTSTWIDTNQSELLGKPQTVKATAVTRRWWAGAAAAALVAIGTATATGLLNGRASARTGVGERTSLSLPDGGRLDVNTDSSVEWKFTRKVRSLWLKRGEVALNVTADERPLEVQALGQVLLFATGEYNLRLRGPTVEIAVVRGKGKIVGGSGAPGTSVAAGHSASIKADYPAEIRTADPQELEVVSAWRKDELVLNGITLAAAVNEYNRYLKSKIVIDDPSLSGIRLGGRFTTRDPAEFVKALKASFGISSKRTRDGTVHLGAKS